jgi:subfamily B ATP-binding cassette protein MsbA
MKIDSDIARRLTEFVTNPAAMAITVGAVAVVGTAFVMLFKRGIILRRVRDHYGRLLKYLVRYKLAVVITLLVTALYASSSVGRAALSGPVVEKIFQNTDTASLLDRALPIVYAALALAVGMAVGGFLKTYFKEYVTGRIVVDLRTDVANNLLGLSLDFYDKKKTGDLLTRMTFDVKVAQGSVELLLGDIIEQPLTIAASVVVAFAASWQLSLVVFLGMPLLVIPLKKLGKKIRKSSRKSLERLADATQTISQAFTGIKIVKAFGTEAEEKQKFHRENEGYFRKFLSVVRAKSGSIAFAEFVSNAGAAALLALGCYALTKTWWNLKTGDLVTFVVANGMMYKAVKDMVRSVNKLQESMPGAQRVFELMELRPTITDAPNAQVLPPFSQDILFRNVTFTYDKEPVLKDVNLDVRAGELVAVVGPSGAGKTTLLNLIPRFYDVRDGAIEIDGRDVRQVTRASLVSQIAIVGQEPFLFHTTIRDNIRYGNQSATDEDIIAAAKAANAHDFIVNELSEGYDTQVGEQGVRISGGQRQRITIARAILKNAPILILDEATSSLDSESERLVQDALNRLMSNRTTFVIAHRLSTVMHADKIVVLENGEVVGIGKHDELLITCPTYKKLYTSQFSRTVTERFTL